MKILKRASVLALAALSLFNLTACDKKKEGPAVDPNKTQFYIGNFNGGFGHAWVDEAAKRFEEKFADKSFEPGKKGVQIWVNNGKDEFTGWTFYTTIAGRVEDMYIGGEMRQEILDGDLVLPLNDIMDEPLTEFGETKTIREKLSPYYIDAHYLDTKDTPVQFIPFAEAYFGNWSYDIDLFEEKEFFMKEGGGYTGAENKTKGLDGIAGTYDDGLPTTEDEFFRLLNYISNSGVIPATWTGQYGAYSLAWATNLFLNFDDGVGQKMFNKGFGEYHNDKTDTHIVLDGSGYDFYKIQTHPGKLEALETVYKLVKSPKYYSSEAYKTTQSHIEAQDEFITSVMADKSIAMILEGTWWENEALDTFKRMEKYGDYGKNQRRFGVMNPFHYDNGTAEKANYLTSNHYLSINANTDHADLAKLFIKYLCTDEIRDLFTRETGCPSPFDYQISDETYNSLSNFGKTLWEIHENKHGKINFVTEHCNVNPARLTNMVKFPYIFMSNFLQPDSDVGPESSPFTFFKYDTEGYSAQDYFDGLETYANLVYDKYYAGHTVVLRDGSTTTLPAREK